MGKVFSRNARRQSTMGDGLVFWEYPDPVVWWHLILWGCVVAFGSFCIGATGAGGIISVPATLLLPGMTGPAAIGTSQLGFFPLAVTKAVIWHQAGKIPWKRSLPLAAAGLPCGLVGQLVVSVMPKGVLGIIVSVFCIFAGTKAMQMGVKSVREEQPVVAEAAGDGECGDTTSDPSRVPNPIFVEQPQAGSNVMQVKADTQSPTVPELKKDDETVKQEDETMKQEELHGGAKKDPRFGDALEVVAEETTDDGAGTDWGETRLFLVVGGVVAFCASISGSGAPLVFFPLMLILRPEMPMHVLIGLSVPYSLSLLVGTIIGAFLFNTVDMALALIMGCITASFVAIGSMIGLRLNNGQLRIALGIVLLICSIVLIVKIAIIDKDFT